MPAGCAWEVTTLRFVAQFGRKKKKKQVAQDNDALAVSQSLPHQPSPEVEEEEEEEDDDEDASKYDLFAGMDDDELLSVSA